MQLIVEIAKSFIEGFCQGACVPRKEVIQADKEVRESMTEKQLDKMIVDTFPASDPPSTY